MTTSEIYTYSRTGTQIINAAFRKCSMLAAGETASSEMLANGLEALEILIKAWNADGIRLWKYEEMILFLVANQQSYDLGASGDSFLKKSALTTTTMKVAGVSTDLTIDVDSITGITSGDSIGIVIDDNTIHWTTVNGAPAGDTVTITIALDGAAAIGNAVYVYTSKAPRPLQVTHGRVQTDTNSEIELTKLAREDYFRLSNKAASGVPVEFHYNPRLTNGKLYLYPTTSNETYYLNLTVKIPIESFSSASNNPEFPEEWFLPLVWCLAQQLYIEFGIIDPITVQKIEKEADKWYEIISDFDSEDSDIVFQPDMGG